MKISSELIEKAFGEWWTKTGYKLTGDPELSLDDVENAFKAAFALLAPVIEKLVEANEFYADHNNWQTNSGSRSLLNAINDYDLEPYKTRSRATVEEAGGKTAREAKKFVEQVLMKLGGGG